ncbi:hypothetical protein SUGI_0171030 [Cryptomeria japonica]|nr:hypothetical protein SUGI_0171030 [Cryptomeria japonica]
MTFELSNEVWKESLDFLKNKGLFVKWAGKWLTFSKFRNWCDQNWGEGMDLRTLGNGYYLVFCPSAQDRDWILDNGPFFIEGKGLNISVWSPKFNPFEATIEKTLIWIKLPGLPQEYKDVETLKQIGNHLGEFVKSEELVDPSYFSMISRLCWIEKDWEINSTGKYYGFGGRGAQMDNIEYQKYIIDETFMAEAQSIALINRKKVSEKGREECFLLNTGREGSLVEMDSQEGGWREMTSREEGNKHHSQENKAPLQEENTSDSLMCMINDQITKQGTTLTNLSPNAMILMEDNIVRPNQEIEAYSEQMQSIGNSKKTGRGLDPTGEEPIFKDIQISPIRNLNSAFEGVEDSGGNFTGSDYDYESLGFQDEVDELGLTTEVGVLENRSLETTLSLQTKAQVGEKKKRGRKSQKFKLELVGNVAGQSKLRSRVAMPLTRFA